MLRKNGASDVGQLSEACARGDLARVNELITAGAKVNETDEAGQTPLLYAVRRGHPEIARGLLENGANINQFCADGMTPYALFQFIGGRFKDPKMAAYQWEISTEDARSRIADFEALFKQYPHDLNYKDASGQTALHRAAMTGSTFIDFLLELKPDINLTDNQGNTALLLAASSPLASDLETSATSGDQTAPREWNAEAFVAHSLIKAGAKVDLKTPSGQTVGELAMAAAVKAKNPQLISVLRDAGVAETAPSAP